LLRSPRPELAWLRDFARRNSEAWEVWRKLNECAESHAPLPLVAARPDPSAQLSPVPTAHPRPVAPALSVVIPCYNQGPLLLEALESVRQADDGLHETIIVDDGSDDPATVRIMAAVEAAGWRVIRQPNQGLSAARNAGCEAAAGDYVLPLDADNRIGPAYIRSGIEVLRQSPQVGVVYGDCELFGEQSGRREAPDFDLHRLCLGNFIDACAVIRKQAWRDAGGYDPRSRCFEDWDLWLSIAGRGWELRRLPEVMFSYRVRAGSMLSQGNRPDHFYEVVRHLAGKHRYYADHAAELIADLSRIRLLYEESRRASEGYVRSLEDDRARHLLDQQRQAARLAELESARHGWAAERETLVAQCRQAETYALSLQASRAELEAYARSLEAARREVVRRTA
jgi:glycosyltransferase involved in cell wall biosynthesis